MLKTFNRLWILFLFNKCNVWILEIRENINFSLSSRCVSLEEGRCVKEKVISMYRELESILKSDEYLEDLRFELEHYNPNYLTILEKRIKDMEKSDHGIVVAGKWDFVKVNLIIN